jgi:predicted choloylglycine hydrolase
VLKGIGPFLINPRTRRRAITLTFHQFRYGWAASRACVRAILTICACQEILDSMELTFYGLRESAPGPRWQALYDATWPAYRAWYLSEGTGVRPSRQIATNMLRHHMPELMPTWERLVELSGGDDDTARMLTLYDPPRFLPGCSQAVLTGDEPLLVRNYDYRPDLCERVVYSSQFTGRRVIGSGDCLWGLVDGMNDAGLVVSLAFGGRPGSGPGFGIPLVVRYLLEVAETLTDVRTVLQRVPVHMAYNLTVLDRAGQAATLYVAPQTEPQVFPLPAATNHRGLTPDWPEHAQRFRSVSRQRHLLDLLHSAPEPDDLVAAFLQPPLYNTDYAGGFGTVYTAAYRPDRGAVEYHWPDSVWRRTFDTPDGTHQAVLGEPARPT